MASLIFSRSFLRKTLPIVNRRLVSTSKKNNETVAAEVTKATNKVKAVEEKNWISYGFSESSKKDDRTAMHSIFFASVTLCLTGGVFVFLYYPDFHLQDWAVREAFLELKRREDNGLPLIDPNFIDPAKIPLPSDEELGNTEIII